MVQDGKNDQTNEAKTVLYHVDLPTIQSKPESGLPHCDKFHCPSSFSLFFFQTKITSTTTTNQGHILLLITSSNYRVLTQFRICY